MQSSEDKKYYAKPLRPAKILYNRFKQATTMVSFRNLQDRTYSCVYT